MGVLDFFKKKGPEQMDAPPMAPAELLKEPIQDLKLPPLPTLEQEMEQVPAPQMTPAPDMPLPSALPPQSSMPLSVEEDIPLPPIDLMPRRQAEPMKASEPMQPPLSDMPKRNGQGPIFIKVDEYKDILENVNTVRNKLKETDYVVEALGELKNKLDSEFEQWREELEEMQRKLLYMDKVLFENKGQT